MQVSVQPTRAVTQTLLQNAGRSHGHCFGDAEGMMSAGTIPHGQIINSASAYSIS
jgi:hypothetical protein